MTAEESPQPTAPPALWKSARAAVTSESFIEKFILLIITATLTGLMLPAIMGNLQQKRIRNDAILDAQRTLFYDLSSSMLKYQTMALDVTWFKDSAGYSEEMHQKAFERYNQEMTATISDLRSQAARSKALTSPAITTKIDNYVQDVFNEQDTPIQILHRDKASKEKWAAQHQRSIKMLARTNALVDQIARDLELSKNDLK